MVLRTVLLALVFSSAAHAAEFDRTLTVAPGSDLYVSTGSGHIHVFAGSDTAIHVKANVYAGWLSGGDVSERIARIVNNPPIRQAGTVVRLGEVAPEDRHIFNNITVDYEISAPRDVALNLHSGSGDIQIDQVGRFLKTDTGSGNVRVDGTAGMADLHTGSGDIDLRQQSAGEVRVSTGSGSIHVTAFSGALTARTGSGDIEAKGDLTGAAKLQSGSGSIRLHLGPNAHYTVEASTGSGSIRVPGNSSSDSHHLSQPVNGGGPILEAHTGSGDINVD